MEKLPQTRRLLEFFLALAILAHPAGLLSSQPAFVTEDAAPPEGWRAWAPRAEIAPRTYFDPTHSRSGNGSLVTEGRNNRACFGGWQRAVSGIVPGKWYHFEASYHAEGVDFEDRQVVARLDWTTAKGDRVRQPDFPWKVTSTPDGWKKVVFDGEAPPEATVVKIQLLLLNAPHAIVRWDEIGLTPTSAPRPRPVVVAAMNLFPRDTADPVGQFIAVLGRSLPAKTDIVVLPEGITAVGTGKSYVDGAESIPGPTTDRLGEFAQSHQVWIVAGVYEREGPVVYNTAVLINRAGKLAGRYRKVYLPREELEGGLTPGSNFPVFKTDFGTVGMMICWDTEYTDPARALALRGAELILVPIAGGSETLLKARAIENHLFVASAGYDFPTYVVDPDGNVMARAEERGSIAVATIDLNRQYRDAWLGNMSDRFRKELRFDLPVNPCVSCDAK